MRIISAAAVLLTWMSVATPAAHAADGAICFSDIITYTFPAPPSTGTYTMTYPQVSNATLFQCSATAGKFTFKQLSQAGWIIEGVGQQLYSSSTNVGTGATTHKIRWMLTIQK